MHIMYERCAGLDVHKKTVVACVLTPAGPETRTFGTMTAELLTLADWLLISGCTHVAMESTGDYWKPVFNILEGTFELLLVNAQHVKAVPGCKTDVKDAAWLAELLQHGLLRASFIPPVAQRELRDLTRYRSTFIQERVTLINRVQKLLEDANIKLAAVASDIMGVSGRAILAVAHSMLVMAYYMIQRREPYREAGADFFDRLQPEDTARRLVKRLQSLAYHVTLQSPSTDAIP
jgi:transposase